jgi:hypothetical protein
MITPDYFQILDFWFYTVGVNICPADIRNKKTTESRRPKQNTPMTAEEYEELKKTGAFIRGAAVITGKVWQGDYVGYHPRTISATVTVLTKSNKVYDPDERWTTQKIRDELVLNPSNGTKGK